MILLTFHLVGLAWCCREVLDLPGTGCRGESGEKVVYSGDYVRRDEEGFLYFVGRRDHMIKRSGFRMSPDEIEEILLRCESVSEAAVRPVCGPTGEVELVAHVVAQSEGCLSADDLLQFCRREMPTHMVPSSVEFHAALPRTANGKIDRQRLES